MTICKKLYYIDYKEDFIMLKKFISAKNAPAAIGPYSQGVRVGEFVFVSGQLPIDPKTGVLLDGEIGEKTVRVIKNVEAILQAVGANLNNVVKTTVFLKDISNFTEMNEVYNKYFKDSLPARSAVQIAALPKGADIEMEVIAYLF